MKLRHYLYIVSLVALAACNNEELTSSDFVGEEIRLSAATISGNAAVTTRAAEGTTYKAFKANTAITLQVNGTWTGQTLTDIVKTTIATAATTTSNSDLTLSPALYWDDYGSADPANATTGRTAGLTIYGAAADGATTAPTVTDWTALVWDLGANQNIDSKDFCAKDLMLSNNVKDNNTYRFEARADGKLLQFYHVLSKITVNLKAGEGFKDNKFENDPVVVLTSNEANGKNEEWAYTSGTFNVTTRELSESSLNTHNAVTMHQAATPAENYTVTKEALIMPGSTFANDDATILSINADGNIYYIKAEKIRTAIDKTDHGNDTPYPTEAGKNYIINVTVNKTDVAVTATVKEWENVDSEKETPEIRFTADVKSISNTTTGGSMSKDDTFTLWKNNNLTDFSTAEKRTVTYDGTNYTCDTRLCWQSASDDSYFRALATKTATGIVAETDTKVAQGVDLLWGTTDVHTGTEADGKTTHEYAEGAIIKPRTNTVPLIFKHALSNIVVELETTKDASEVELKDATVSMSNLYTDGTIDIAYGTVTVPDGCKQSTVTVSDGTIMVPQEIDGEAKLIITLDDGTKYSLQLNTCEDSSNAAIATWESGKQYKYTITLAKEAVKFRVLVQDWEKKEGSGNATLDWD